MIDFTNAIEEFNNYKGSEKKKTLIYNNKKYLVKFPDPIREKIKIYHISIMLFQNILEAIYLKYVVLKFKIQYWGSIIIMEKKR